jgi:hypothetical protein
MERHMDSDDDQFFKLSYYYRFGGGMALDSTQNSVPISYAVYQR